MTAALLVIGGAIAHAAWNLLVKRQRASGPAFFAIAVGAAVVLGAPLAIPPLLASESPWLGWAAGSAVLHTGYMLVLQRAYRAADVGVVYPLARGTGPLLSVLGAVVLLGERPTATVVIGAAVVIAGVVVIGTASARSAAVGSRDAPGRRRHGILYGATVGAVIAGYTLWDASAVVSAGLEPLAHFWASLVGQFVLLVLIALRQRAALVGEVRRHAGVAVVVGVLSTLSYVAILTAFQLAPVAVVAPAREVSVVLVALGGWLFFGEPHPVRRLVGSAVVLAGVALLTV